MSLPSGVHQPAGGNPDYGVILRLHISDRFYGTEIQVAAPATSDSTVPLTSTATRLVVKSGGVSLHTHVLPNDGQVTHYRARHVADGFDDGPFTGWVNASPRDLTGNADGGLRNPVEPRNPDEDATGFEGPFWSEGRRRGDTFYSSDERLKNRVRVADGSASFAINRHNESGLAEHTEAVTFSNDYEASPRITFVPQKAKVYSESTDLGSTAAQFMDLAAESLTVAGFTLRAVLASSQSSSENTDGWSTAQNTAAPENGDVTLSLDGDVAFSNLEDADAASAAVYRGFFQVADSSKIDGLMTVEFGFNASSTSTSFTVGDSRTFDNDSDSTQEELAVNTQLGADYDLLMRLSYSPSPSGTSALATITAHGEDNAVPGVQWNKILGGVEESMTPSTGQKVLWQATETP